MSKKNDWIIEAKRVFKCKDIAFLKNIHHPGNGEIRVFSSQGKKYLVKKYIDEKYTAREAINIWNVQNTGIHVPRYYGFQNGFLFEEYIEGKLFQDVISQREFQEAIYMKAIHEISVLHHSKDSLRDKRKLKRIFERKPLKKRIEMFFYFITHFGFPAFEKFSKVKKNWILALKKISIPDLVNIHSVRGDSYIIGHGDYKPNNLIVTHSGLYIIDWLSMAKAQPWYDLSYLLVNVDDMKKKEEFVYQYLQETNSKLSIAKAMQLFKSGMIYQELQRAKSNSHRIYSKKDMHHIEEFRKAMDGISSVVL